MLDAQPAPLVQVQDLKMHFPIYTGLFRKHTGDVKAVDGVSFDIMAGQTLGLVGESGCGKSTVGRAMLRLYEPTAGRVVIDGDDVATLAPEALRKKRPTMQMVFQDPQASLNPRMTLADIVSEPLDEHTSWTRDQKLERVYELMDQVGLNRRFANRFPHEFSGGQRQRIGIARALALKPKFIVCDEPIAALDVSIQAQVIDLLKRLCREQGAAVMLVTHDMGVIAEACDRVAVMYAGRIVEIGAVRDVVHAPAHPYTVGLMRSIPSMNEGRERLAQIDGSMPRLDAIPVGCAFHPRCPHAFDRCRAERPMLADVGRTRAACWLLEPASERPA